MHAAAELLVIGHFLLQPYRRVSAGKKYILYSKIPAATMQQHLSHCGVLIQSVQGTLLCAGPAHGMDSG
jgi:hypothetical protein